MSTLLLGNTAVLEVFHHQVADVADRDYLIRKYGVSPVETAVETDDGEILDLVFNVERTDLGAQITCVTFPDDHDLLQKAADVRAVWPQQSSDLPEWVECDDVALAQIVSTMFSNAEHTCQVGRPEDWSGPASYEGDGEDLPPTDPELWADLFGMGRRQGHEHNPFDGQLNGARTRYLLTNGGKDKLFDQHLGTSAQPAAFNYVALTANNTAASTSSTTLTGEITTAGGGLLRAQATYAHTTGTSTATLTITKTANGSDALPVTIAKIGILNASSSGTLGYETLLSSTATLSASGDALTVTDTVTVS